MIDPGRLRRLRGSLRHDWLPRLQPQRGGSRKGFRGYTPGMVPSSAPRRHDPRPGGVPPPSPRWRAYRTRRPLVFCRACPSASLSTPDDDSGTGGVPSRSGYQPGRASWSVVTRTGERGGTRPLGGVGNGSTSRAVPRSPHLLTDRTQEVAGSSPASSIETPGRQGFSLWPLL
jgi:hypothetical protein